MGSAPRQLSNARVSVIGLNSSGPIEALAVVSLDSTGGIGTPGAGSTQVSIREIMTLGGTSAMDSTANALRVNVVAGSAAGDTSVTVSTGSVRVHQSTAADLNAAVVQGSTVWAVQVSSVAGIQTHQVVDRDNSTKVAAVLGGTPASTTYGLVVREAAYVAPSTTIQVSSLAGKVTVAQNSTVWAVQVDGLVRAQNSTIGDFLASVQQNSTVWQTQTKIQDSSGVTIGGSTGRPSTGAQGLLTREILNDLQSTGTSTAGQTSTRTALVSSVAAQRIKVYAYLVTSTVVTASTCFFASSNAQKLWPMNLGTQSSGITGAAHAVSPPGWLFATAAGENLQFITPSSGPEFHVSISYFIEA